jgi:hypothetical protein
MNRAQMRISTLDDAIVVTETAAKIAGKLNRFVRQARLTVARGVLPYIACD